MSPHQIIVLSLFLLSCDIARAFAPPTYQSSSASIFLGRRSSRPLFSSTGGDGDDEAAKLRAKAEELREEIKKMEENLGEVRPRFIPEVPIEEEDEILGMSLRNKKVLVVGANGRLGSMVCRYLLRNVPDIGEVVAGVHTVSENSVSSRGYGRLSYEVGAEDGVGTIGAAWSADDRTASFMWSDEMKDYNLQNLRLVEMELLDPVQCQTVTEGMDCVIWCATDFNGNTPRAISGLNIAFLFRAVADPTKGRVEVEGLRNILGGLKNGKQSTAWNERDGEPSVFGGKPSKPSNNPIDVVLVSTAPNAFEDFETPFGTFNGLKREGENIIKNEFPSLSYTVLQMAAYDDNFVEESLDIVTEESNPEGDPKEEYRRRINRRDAARAAGDALVNEDLLGKTVQVWTATR